MIFPTLTTEDCPPVYPVPKLGYGIYEQLGHVPYCRGRLYECTLTVSVNTISAPSAQTLHQPIGGIPLLTAAVAPVATQWQVSKVSWNS